MTLTAPLAKQRAPRSGAHSHVVQFFEDDAVLVTAVADYLCDGLLAGEPVLAVATAEHRAAFVRRIERAGLDVSVLRDAGQLALLDAEDTLAEIMVDGAPDRARFLGVVGGALAALTQGRSARVRAFGEMVDVLWLQGNGKAALALEELWNDLARTHHFALLCAYVMGNFCKDTDSEPFHEVCKSHSHVIPAESYSGLDGPQARDREIARLQQREGVLGREIAHRKRLESDLRDALRDRRHVEETLRDFIENAVYPLHSVDANGVILWTNQAELDLFGYAREEYVGHPIAEFHVDEEVIADILARLLRGETVKEQEARVRCKSGAVKTVRMTSNVTWEHGVFVRSRCFTQDVTARKDAEAQRAASAELLAAALARETAAREEAERTVRFNEMFAGILGHDLRNPLSAITAGAHYLVRMNAGEKVARTAGRILSSADRMARMIDQILDFTRIRVGEGFPLRREPMDLADLCHRVREEIEAAHPECSVDIACAGDGVGCWDLDRLLQVFSNLVGNAVTHSAEGAPVTVRIEAEGPGWVRAVVHNAGTIAADIHPVLFEPFRGSNKHQRAKGLGLGLFITQQIVKAHGGTIDFASSEGAGTTFTVRLPRSAEGLQG